MRIVAIGGGAFGPEGNDRIDSRIIELTGKTQPKALFIPTASLDAEDYVARFTEAYMNLGASVEVLRLLANSSVEAKRSEATEKISAADLIYVGGGNTKMMLEVWRKFGLPQLLLEFTQKGGVLSGLSAGALCWFRVGNSDWPQYEGAVGVKTARLDCLGFVDLVLCPHTLDEGYRMAEFRSMMVGEYGVGIGLDDGCALEIEDGRFRLLAAQPDRLAHRLRRSGNALYESELFPHEDLRKLSSLNDPRAALERLV